MDNVLKAKAVPAIKSTTNLVAPMENPNNKMPEFMRPREPILRSLHILQKGSLTRHSRSGFC